MTKQRTCIECQKRKAKENCLRCGACYESFRRYKRLQEKEWQQDEEHAKAEADKSKRIVACVNACEGIEKPEMIRPLLERCMIFLDDCYHDETVKEIAELLGK